MDIHDETIPIQYREGKAPFMDIEVAVDARAFIPRPETELLVDIVLRSCRGKEWSRPFVLEIGTGSGIIPISLARALGGSRILSMDISTDALEVAGKNLRKFDLENRVTLMKSDMFGELGDEYVSAFDVLVSNPPYVSAPDYRELDEWVKAEPRCALYSGEEGMDHLEVIAGEGLKYLKPGGLVAVEVGYDQAKKVRSLFLSSGFADVESFTDFSGHERVVTGWKNG